MKSIAVSALVLLASGAIAQQALDAKAAADWYSGVTVEGTTSDGQTFRAYHTSEGKVRAVIDGKYINDGSWLVRGDGAVCVDWRDSSWGKNPCYWIKESADGYWNIERVDNSKNSTRVRRIGGNKYNM